VLTSAATCGKEGVKTFTCQCKEVKTQVIPATGNHTWNQGVITLQPTQETEGEKTYTCNGCKMTRKETVSKLAPTVNINKVKKFKAKSKKKALTLSWKKDKNADGYQIQYSTKASFKGAKTKQVSKNKTSTTIKKLKSNKNYYVRIRAYKKYTNEAGKVVKSYGKWVKIKKKTK